MEKMYPPLKQWLSTLINLPEMSWHFTCCISTYVSLLKQGSLFSSWLPRKSLLIKGSTIYNNDREPIWAILYKVEPISGHWVEHFCDIHLHQICIFWDVFQSRTFSLFTVCFFVLSYCSRNHQSRLSWSQFSRIKISSRVHYWINF